MALEIWTPIKVEPKYSCLVCGEGFLAENLYLRHVPRCVHANEGVVEEYRARKRPDVLFKSADPEYREWQRVTGKLI